MYFRPLNTSVLIKPYEDQPGTRKEQVTEMFNHIAGRYDFLNHLLSFNIDKYWRRVLVKKVKKDLPDIPRESEGASILDVATGTGDLAFALSGIENATITGVDLAENMLTVAREKAARYRTGFQFVKGDSESLPFDPKAFHVVTVAFGVRNFEHLDAGLSEMHRVLKPGGRVYILEFSKPSHGLFSLLYGFYSRAILPLVASVFTRDKAAYRYLPGSIAEFPSGEEMKKILEDCGFTACRSTGLTGGIATIYEGKRPEESVVGNR